MCFCWFHFDPPMTSLDLVQMEGLALTDMFNIFLLNTYIEKADPETRSAVKPVHSGMYWTHLTDGVETLIVGNCVDNLLTWHSLFT